MFAVSRDLGVLLELVYFLLVQTSIFDANDRIKYHTQRVGPTWEYFYDSADRVTKIRSPEGDYDYGYTPNLDEPTSYADPGGETAAWTYDGWGNLSSVTKGGIKEADFMYSLAGDLQALITRGSNYTRWTYDQEGRALNKVNALNVEVERYSYDRTGLVTNKWTPAGGDLRYTYDVSGRLQEMAFLQTPSRPHTIFQHDAAGRLTSMSDEVGTTTFAHNPGVSVAEQSVFNGTITQSFGAGGTNALDIVRSGNPTRHWGFTPDASRRLDTISSPMWGAGINAHYGYLGADNRVASLAYGPGASIANDYPAPMRRWRQTSLTRNPGGPVLGSQTRDYKPNGYVKDVTSSFGNKLHLEYERGQIISATGTEANGAGRLHEQFQYGFDAIGNLTTRTRYGLSQNFQVDAANRLQSVQSSGTLTVAGMTRSVTASLSVNGASASVYTDGTFAATNLSLTAASFTATAQDPAGSTASTNIANPFVSTAGFSYDSNGNLTSGRGRTLEFDALNMLRAVVITNGPNDSTRVEYVYDGQLRKRIRKEYHWSGSWGTPIVRKYEYQGRLPMQELDGNGVPLVTYTWGPDLSGEIGGAGGIGGLIARTDHATDFTGFYHSDQSGNVLTVVTSNGGILARYIYDPFGNLLGSTGQWAEANRFRFSSKDYDPVTGLYDFGFRWYDPNLQRWINEDPLGEAGGLNLSGFVGNNPVHRLDPLGLAWYDYIPGIGSGIRQWQGNNAVNTMLQAKGYGSMKEFQLDHPGFGGSVTAGDVPAVKAWAAIAGGAASVYLAMATSVTPTAGAAGCVGAFESQGAKALGAAGNLIRPANNKYYSVVMEAKLRPGTFMASDANHFRQANRQLYEMLQSDPSLAKTLEAEYPGMTAHVRPGPRGGFADTSPPGLSWHHDPQTAGNLQLVPRSQHQAPGPVQETLHPGQQGGREIWGGGR